MFKNEIHAWANGPVVVDLYPFHKGTYMVDSWPFGDPDKVDSDRRETLENIIHAYGHLSNSYLTDTVRSEMAYKEARDGLRADERVEQEMTADMICYHYMALDLNPTALPVEELNPEYY
jgi:uncharacterized phage-associated protein